MTSLLAEQPVLLSVLLTLSGAACLYAWLQTGQRGVGLLGVGCFVLIPVAFFIAAVWHTDREQITELLHSTATALEANDVEAVVAVMDPQQPDVRQQVTTEMPNYVFSKASVGQVRSLTFIEAAVPPEAQVDITANVTVAPRNGSFAETQVSRRVILRVRKQGDRWYVTEYTHLPLIGGPDGYTPDSELTRSYRDL